MSTQIQTTQVTKPEEVKKERKSWSVRLEDGSGSMLRVAASKRGDGTARTQVIHTTRDGKKKVNTRGATEQHATLELAKTAQAKIVAKAVAMGWRKTETRRGFEAKPDQFSVETLPKPATKVAGKKVAA